MGNLPQPEKESAGLKGTRMDTIKHEIFLLADKHVYAECGTFTQFPPVGGFPKHTQEHRVCGPMGTRVKNANLAMTFSRPGAQAAIRPRSCMSSDISRVSTRFQNERLAGQACGPWSSR